jgi:3-oxoacyl-[acyl-carrier protein] reductase
MRELDGKVALITGGSRGIGAAIARAMAGRGADVAITYHTSTADAAAVVQAIEETGQRGMTIQADSADPAALVAAVEHAAARLGRLDILVNNAGIFPFGPLEEMPLETIDSTFAIHVRAVYLASQAALRHMGEGGTILSIGSCYATRVPEAGLTLYAMSKSALIGFTKGLAREVGGRGITVNVIDPGSTDTEMNPADGASADAERQLLAVGRYGRPEEIAAMAVHLAGPDGRFVTGAAIAVDGGYGA